jgi:uncharacterized protein YbjT (DUF2867 family)
MTCKVLATGATGDTGRSTVRESLALKLQVRALVHSKHKRSGALEDLGAETVVGDLLDINTVRAAMGVPPYVVQHLRLSDRTYVRSRQQRRKADRTQIHDGW